MAAALLALAACSTDQGGSAVDARASTAHAWKLCKIADRAGMTTKPCTVAGSNLHLTIASRGTREPTAFCHELRMAAVESDLAFDKPMTVRIYSAFSANGPLATCSLG